MSGDVRLHLGREVTGPISLHATNNKILNELHNLQGVGSIEIIGSGRVMDTSGNHEIVEMVGFRSLPY